MKKGLVAFLVAFVQIAAIKCVGDDVHLQNATATYSQAASGNFYATSAIDGSIDSDNGWAIQGNIQNQTAVFETSDDVGFKDGSILTFKLFQDFWYPSHLLGRFRISITTDDRSSFADELQSNGDVSANWVVLSPSFLSSDGGATMAKLNDDSVLVGGILPNTDTYTFRASTLLTNITGIRLEVLQDPSLPFNGPGRQPLQGNFVLSELQVAIDPAISNTPPDIAFSPGNTDQTIQEDTSTAQISFTVSDAQTSPSGLTIKGHSSNPTLVADAGIIISGSGSTRTVQVTPRPNESGTAKITLTVTDSGGLTNRVSFNLTVEPVDDPPRISVTVATISITAGITSAPIPFSINDPDTPLDQIKITASSQNQTLIPDANLKITPSLPGLDSTYYLTISPAPGQTGITKVVITAKDLSSSAAATLNIIVKSNTAPFITKISDLTIERNTSTNVAFQIGDNETPSNLTLSVTSSNPTLIPTNKLTILGLGTARQLRIEPAVDQIGAANIAVSVSDGALTAITSFVLTVVKPNTGPRISELETVTTTEGVSTGPLHVAIMDDETAPDALSFSVTVGSSQLVPPENITLGGSGTNRTVTLIPVLGQTGVTLVTMTVSDGQKIAHSYFLLKVVSASARQVRLSDTNAIRGGVVTLPMELVSLGDENALGFTLSFSTLVFQFSSASLGADATGAALNLNRSQEGSGLVGMALALPASQTFQAGTRKIVEVTLKIVDTGAYESAGVGFANQPVAKDAVDINANSLPIGFTPAVISFVDGGGYEGDVSPRSIGNGSVTIADWVQVGRFAAGLDTAINGPEFQRADCAPRSQNGALVLGNGTITVADWVQAGRYAAGLDPATVAGGPVNAVGKSSASAGGAAGKAGLGSRILKLVSSADGLSVDVVLSGPGGEAGAGFSVDFNAAGLRFVSAEPGAGLNGGSLIVNDLAAGTGRIGFALAAPQGGSFGQSPATLARLHFASAGASTTSPVHFSDEPIARELVDAAVNTLSVRYVNSDASGDSTAVDGGQLVIRRSGNAVVLSWPTSLGSGALEQTGDLGSGSWQPVAGNPQTVGGQYELEVGTDGAASFFRLHTP